MAPEKRPHWDEWPRREAWLPTNSLYFPSRSGIVIQRRVRTRLPAPPASRRFRRRRGRSASRPPPTPWLRGVLGEGRGEGEPETAGYGLGRRLGRCLSPLPSWAVRIRSRFVSAKAEAQQTGNTMVAVRPPEVADESVEQTPAIPNAETLEGFAPQLLLKSGCSFKNLDSSRIVICAGAAGTEKRTQDGIPMPDTGMQKTR
jgi:hypothetical protein